MPLAPGTRLGRYEVRSLLGAGGMGEVYLAHDTSELERAVSVKILPAELASDQERMRRFIQEAKAVSALNHPNILTVHEIGRAKGTRFIVTEYVDGVTLREYLRGRHIRLHEVLDVSVQVAAALDAAHEAHVIHRDIKPENIMVRRRDSIVKVLDFGLAKLTEGAGGAAGRRQAVDTEAGTEVLVRTEPGRVMGTAAYMSPEQSRGLEVDARTDIWSLGVVLYEMVAGRVPFEGKDVHRQIVAIQDEEPPPLARVASGVPERLEEIVQKALAKDPEDRYQTARDLLIDLRNLRRKLEVDAEIERTVPPELRSAASGAGGPQAPASAARHPAAQTTAAGQAQTTSSAEYIAGQIKQHKRGALLAAFALVAVASIALYFYSTRRGGGEAIDSVAVLPLVNESRDPDVDWLADGLTESVIYKLSQLPGLKVLARSTVFRYKGRDVDAAQAARELQVRAVLTGRVMQRGDELTVSAELIDARDGRLLWGERYERKMTDLNSVQQEIARAASEKLRQRLTGEEQRQLAKGNTGSAEAYQDYLKGRFHLNKFTEAEVRRALDYFNQAVALDPDYALAYAGLADTYWGMADWILPPAEAAPRAKAAAAKAVELDGSLPEAHAALGTVLLRFDYDWAGAEKELRKATELNPRAALPHDSYAAYLAAAGRFDEAARESKMALDIDPLSPSYNLTLGWVYQLAHQDEEAVEQLRRAIELDPNIARAHLTLAFAYYHMGRLDEAVAEADRAGQLDDAWFISSDRAYIYAVTGRRAEAQRLLDKLLELSRQRYVSSFAIVFPYVGLGDKDKAIYWLNRAYETRSDGLIGLKVYWSLDPLRSDPRFQDLQRRVGLTP
jgi:eukaryotic-like serine/threonine-protein kinase